MFIILLVLITPFECDTFSKKMIRTLEYEINFKLLCANKLMAIGNNCAVDKAINVIFRIKITSHNFLSNYKVVCLT